MKEQKVDLTTVLTPLLANKGSLVAIVLLAILFGKTLLIAGVMGLVGHLAGKVMNRMEERKKVTI